MPTNTYQDAVLNTISLDPRVKKLIAAGDAHGINKRIREIYNERQNQNAFGEVIQYGSATMPQFNTKGEIVYQKYSDATPTTQQAKAVKQQSRPASAPAPAPVAAQVAAPVKAPVKAQVKAQVKAPIK